MNRAARIGAAAKSGQVWVSEGAWHAAQPDTNVGVGLSMSQQAVSSRPPSSAMIEGARQSSSSHHLSSQQVTPSALHPASLSSTLSGATDPGQLDVVAVATVDGVGGGVGLQAGSTGAGVMPGSGTCSTTQGGSTGGGVVHGGSTCVIREVIGTPLGSFKLKGITDEMQLVRVLYLD